MVLYCYCYQVRVCSHLVASMKMLRAHHPALSLCLCVCVYVCRMAVELNLNKPPPPNSTPAKPEDERHEREMLNNRRTWMLCCIMDYSTAMQLGKPPTILEDEVSFLVHFICGARCSSCTTRCSRCRPFGVRAVGCLVFCVLTMGSVVDPERGALVLVEHVPAPVRCASAGDHQLLEDHEWVHRGRVEYSAAFAGAFLIPPSLVFNPNLVS